MSTKTKSTARIESEVRNIVAVMCKSPKTFKEPKLTDVSLDDKIEIATRVLSVADSMGLPVWSEALAVQIKNLRESVVLTVETLRDILYDGTADELKAFFNTSPDFKFDDTRLGLEDIMLTAHGCKKIIALYDLKQLTKEDLRKFVIEHYDYKHPIEDSKSLIVKAGLTNKEVWASFNGLNNVCEHSDIIKRDIIGQLFPKKPFKTDIVANVLIHSAKNGKALLEGLVYLSKFKEQVDLTEVANHAIKRFEEHISPYYTCGKLDIDQAATLFEQVYKMGVKPVALKVVLDTIVNGYGSSQEFKLLEREVKSRIPELKNNLQRSEDVYDTELYAI